MKRLICLGLCLGAGAAVRTAQAETPRAVLGNFFAAPDGPVIAIAECGTDKLCGRIVGLGKLPATDARNPNAAQKGRRLCGLTVLTVAKTMYMRPGAYWEGQYYHAEKGMRYNALMVLQREGSISLGGTAGDPMLERIFPFLIDWQPAPSTFIACTAPLS